MTMTIRAKGAIFGALALVAALVLPVVPGGAHTPENECTRSIRHELFRTGTTKGLDTGCMAKVQPSPFKLPTTAAAGKPTP